MKNPYGPWATLIDTGGNPQLSAFWRRRLTMLEPTSRTDPLLSRRNLLSLGAAALLLLLLPTFQAAAIVAEEEKPASQGSDIPAGPNVKASPSKDGYPGTLWWTAQESSNLDAPKMNIGEARLGRSVDAATSTGYAAVITLDGSNADTVERNKGLASKEIIRYSDVYNGKSVNTLRGIKVDARPFLEAGTDLSLEGMQPTLNRVGAVHVSGGTLGGDVNVFNGAIKDGNATHPLLGNRFSGGISMAELHAKVSPKESSGGGEPSKNNTPGKGTVVGTVTVKGDPNRMSFLCLPLSVSYGLSREDNRKDLKFTGEQEKKLREISKIYLKQRMDNDNKMRKDLENLPQQERTAKLREHKAMSVKEAIAVRKQVEAMLTPEQRTAVRSIAMGLQGYGQLTSEPQFRSKVGVTEEQMQELSKQLTQGEEAQKKMRRREEAMKENKEKMQAVITPQQWEQVDRIRYFANVGESTLGDKFSMLSLYPGTEWAELNNPDTRKQLALSEEQKSKLAEFFAKTQSQSTELSKIVDDMNSPIPEKERKAKQVEFNRKLEELRERDLRRIEGLLAKQQLATLNKIKIRRELFDQLLMSVSYDSGKNDNKPFGIFERAKVTESQMKELRQLNVEQYRLMQQFQRETGETVLKILSPQQQEKLLDAIDDRGL
jgi:hypothetical protein